MPDLTTLSTNYGKLRAGQPYELVGYERDCMLIKCNGRIIYVPKQLEGQPFKPYDTTKEEENGYQKESRQKRQERKQRSVRD